MNILSITIGFLIFPVLVYIWQIFANLQGKPLAVSMFVRGLSKSCLDEGPFTGFHVMVKVNLPNVLNSLILLLLCC